ncbi:translation initiation factor eIF-2B subunit alpha-like [Oppia nitens]|uniref:translation initiation factor eIF-2B subunit alpha-like n=1 Tax=Oppia nitens TaxID=1686743 RepID=UPI0023DBECEC|nr:translation initiation factor eIF-2B subunit alpha-like [Oppia nitens]
MDNQSICQHYRQELAVESSPAIATLKTLIEYLKRDESTTASGLRDNVRSAIELLKNTESRTEVESVAEIYFRFITLKASEYDEFRELKSELSRRSDLFLKKMMECRKKVAKNGHPFISDGCTILIHGCSRAVNCTLAEAKKANKRFTVYVTESAPDMSGKIMVEWLKENGIMSTLIIDSAVAYIMERVDIVLVGAEGVAESGGIINKIGTYSVAICAKSMNKPFYALAESFKFIRLYPLNQSDIPDRLKWKTNTDFADHPLVDYTPPSYITLLLTDLGTLTTAAVSDQLMQLYL